MNSKLEADLMNRKKWLGRLGSVAYSDSRNNQYLITMMESLVKNQVVCIQISSVIT
jgi:hypothetical protein